MTYGQARTWLCVALTVPVLIFWFVVQAPGSWSWLHTLYGEHGWLDVPSMVLGFADVGFVGFLLSEWADPKYGRCPRCRERFLRSERSDKHLCPAQRIENRIDQLEHELGIGQ